ncbi:hypothetical protein [Parasitella parasitica]|uniref:Zinc-binding domain-containing protein n=1 Tax=Parasitella parasitica TaxID=35722 RepID=A0A0B7NHT4_9FUNG|nr:hypothetical protein [Parasitella parasitica]
MSHYTDTFYEKAPFNVRMVNFACIKCTRRWSSANGSLEDYQKCKNCYTECYPVGCTIRAPNKVGNENRETYQGHIKELCGKCQRLGKSCMMVGNDDDDDFRVITDADGEELYLYEAQTSQVKARETENKHVLEQYKLSEWPELATYAFEYVPKARKQDRSSRIRPVSSNSKESISRGFTAAETLREVIRRAKSESDEMSNEEEDGKFIADYEHYDDDINRVEEHDYNEEENNEFITDYDHYDYDTYSVEEHGCNDLNEVWEYNSIASDQDNEWDYLHFDGEVPQDEDSDGFLGLNDNGDNRNSEANDEHLSSQSQEAYFHDLNDMILNENLKRFEDLHFEEHMC